MATRATGRPQHAQSSAAAPPGAVGGPSWATPTVTCPLVNSAACCGQRAGRSSRAHLQTRAVLRGRCGRRIGSQYQYHSQGVVGVGSDSVHAMLGTSLVCMY
eukprot:m.213446 g.213446  ORF g.213446 m.213446 type:complete len:102 (+) comp26616_c0_seq1:203-508(+)